MSVCGGLRPAAGGGLSILTPIKNGTLPHAAACIDCRIFGPDRTGSLPWPDFDLALCQERYVPLCGPLYKLAHFRSQPGRAPSERHFSGCSPPPEQYVSFYDRRYTLAHHRSQPGRALSGAIVRDFLNCTCHITHCTGMEDPPPQTIQVLLQAPDVPRSALVPPPQHSTITTTTTTTASTTSTTTSNATSHIATPMLVNLCGVVCLCIP